MRRYYVGQSLKDTIIKGYDIKDQTITVYIEDGMRGIIRKHIFKDRSDILFFENTEENKKQILEKMEKQKKNLDDKKFSLRTRIPFLVGYIIMYIKSYTSLIEPKNELSVATTILVSILYCMLLVIINLIGIDYLIKLHEIKKFFFFEKQKDVINENINDNRVLNGVSDELVSELSKETSSEIKLELNQLNKYSLKDLKRMVLNIKKIKESGEDPLTNNTQNSKLINIRQLIKK